MNLGKEDEYREFKESLGQLDKGLKSITAMLNKHNEATVYFGVDDNGDICGLMIGKNTLRDIRNRIRDKIEPRVYPKIEACKEQGKSYIKVSAAGSDIPYSFDGRYYIRVVSADEQADNTILRKMLASSDADIISQKAAPEQKLKFRSLFALLTAKGYHPNTSEDFLGNFGLLNKKGKYNLNAYLLADHNETRITVVQFDGTDKTVMSSRTEYGGKCLLASIEEVMLYFSALNVTKVDVTQTKRQETSLVDYPSFREAWINACLHNDWNNGIPPSIHVFDDRMEIISYGGLPYSLSLEGFYQGTSVPVNRNLLRIFIAAGLAEQSGHGVPTIVSRYGKDAFSFADGMLVVTIPFAFERDDVRLRKRISLSKNGLSDNQRLVYEILQKDGSLNLQEAADRCGLSLSGVKKICRVLQELGLLKRRGSRRNGYWMAE
ncbi:RNA-binding domain-containing protein [Lachnoclostridium sp. Marseille-P6806]|uniref:RNA-binding domain-containing protein n=1 Tax=Lachnoclostridium sp. Marseille-P6806 TaxID=2364793 RepID=UPI0010322E98|nr:RNA-binding domain-containing protein [Lachnoclostridium sp. Marseille-P6806]